MVTIEPLAGVRLEITGGVTSTIKVEEAEAKLPALSEMETETVWDPSDKGFMGVKVKPEAVT